MKSVCISVKIMQVKVQTESENWALGRGVGRVSQGVARVLAEVQLECELRVGAE